jgi:hypothetical protein
LAISAIWSNGELPVISAPLRTSAKSIEVRTQLASTTEDTMTKQVATFTALGQPFLAHHEEGVVISVYPLTGEAFSLTCTARTQFGDKVALEMAQMDHAERMDTIYRAAREAIGWERSEWYCRVPNDDPPDELLKLVGLPLDPDS